MFKKYNISIVSILVFLVSALMIFSALFTPYVSKAEGATVSLNFKNREYAVNDMVSVEIFLKGLSPETQYNVKLNISHNGFTNLVIKSQVTDALDSLGETDSSIQFQNKVSPDAEGTIACCVLEMFIKGDATKAEISVSAEVTDASGASLNVGGSSAELTVSEKTETPVVTEPPVTEAPTATPSSTVAPSATAPTATAKPTQSPTTAPTATPEATLAPTATAVVTATPEPTLTVIATPEGSNSPLPPINTDDSFTPPPVVPTNNGSDDLKNKGEVDPISVGAVIFWSIVSLVGGIWIGIFIGAAIWRKKSIFMTPSEKKIIGRY